MMSSLQALDHLKAAMAVLLRVSTVVHLKAKVSMAAGTLAVLLSSRVTASSQEATNLSSKEDMDSDRLSKVAILLNKAAGIHHNRAGILLSRVDRVGMVLHHLLATRDGPELHQLLWLILWPHYNLKNRLSR